MTKAEFIEKKDDTIILEIEDDYNVILVELPGNFTPDTFYKSTEDIDIDEESKGFHTCSHSALSKFDSVRCGVSKSGDKDYNVLYGRVVGTNRWEVASFRYEKSDWSADEAKCHCKDNHGVAFESASGKETLCETKSSYNEKSSDFEIKKTDELRHLIYGIALEPEVVDSQGDIETPLEVEKAAHRYMLNLWKSEKPSMIGAEHAYPIESAVVVESYVADHDFYLKGTPRDSDHLVKEGSWVLVSLVKDNEEFEKVLSGEYSGYSIQGNASRRALTS